MMLNRRSFQNLTPKGWLLILGCVALCARLAVTVFFADNHSLYYEYMEIARNILDGKGYSWDEAGRMPLQVSSVLPPIYVLWCLFFIWLSPENFLWMYISQAFVAASGCIPAYLIGDRLFNRRTGFVFAGIYALFPEMVILHSRPVSEFLYVVVALWILYLYLLLRNDFQHNVPRTRHALWIGFLCGLAMLIKESALVLLAAVVIALVASLRPKKRLLIRGIVLILVAVLVTLLPWIIRNSVVQGKVIIVRGGYGPTIWAGNHLGAYGTVWHPNGKKAIDDLSADYEAYMNRMLPLDEQERDRFYFSEVRKFVRNHPVDYLKLCARRLWIFLWFDPTHPLAQNLIYRGFYVAALIVAVPGVILARRRKQLHVIIPLVYFGYALFYIPILMLPRYRIIPLLMILLMAGYFLAFLHDRWKSRITPLSTHI